MSERLTYVPTGSVYLVVRGVLPGSGSVRVVSYYVCCLVADPCVLYHITLLARPPPLSSPRPFDKDRAPANHAYRRIRLSRGSSGRVSVLLFANRMLALLSHDRALASFAKAQVSHYLPNARKVVGSAVHQ